MGTSGQEPPDRQPADLDQPEVAIEEPASTSNPSSASLNERLRAQQERFVTAAARLADIEEGLAHTFEELSVSDPEAAARRRKLAHDAAEAADKARAIVREHHTEPPASPTDHDGR